MMSKEDINNELQSWIASEEFTPDREKLSEIRERYTALREEDEKKALAAFEEEGGEEADFRYVEDAQDLHFRELLTIYNDKRKAREKDRREQQQQNLREKKLLLEELKSLIMDEENIGKAYKRFDAIKQKWNELGSVSRDERREIQGEYSRLIEQFYYNINIYRELQKNDLRKNLELKHEVIEKIKLLEEEKSINQVDFLLHQYLEEWDQLGPTFKEEWEKVREEFRTVVSAVFDRIREHRKAVKDEHAQNYEKKKDLVEQVKAFHDKDFDDVKTIQNMTKQVIEIQKEWKHIGFAGRKRNDIVWKDFREACDAYFQRRNAFLELNNEKFSKVKEEKLALVERAKSIYDGEDTEEIANELKGLQRKWKKAGKLLPQEEYKLFREFRKYCDDFFSRKKKREEEFFKQLEENLAKKEAFLKEVNAKTEAEIKEAGEALIEQWKEKWIELGEVPRKVARQVEKQFQDATAAAYKHLGVSRAELAEKQFEDKLDILSGGEDAEEDLRRELGGIRKRIKDAEMNKLQLENKLDFFTFSDDSNPLKKDLLDRIANEQSEIDVLREKKKKIELTIKGLYRSAETVTEAPDAGQEDEQAE